MGRIKPIRWTLADGRKAVISHCTPKDAAASIAYLRVFFENAPFVATSPGEFRRTAKEQGKMFAARLRHGRQLMIKAVVGGRIVAIAGFECGGRRKIEHQGELGMGVALEFRGMGIGRAILAAILDWAAANPGLEKVALGVYPQNVAARKLYKSVGFRDEGRRLRFFKEKDGTYNDDMVMAIYVKPGAVPRGFRVWPADRNQED